MKNALYVVVIVAMFGVAAVIANQRGWLNLSMVTGVFAGPPEATVELMDRLGERVLRADGSSVESSSALDGKNFVLLYHSASWCGPCKAFTPDLIEMYEQEGGGDVFEVVLVSYDRSVPEAEAYMREFDMPWVMAPMDRQGELRRYTTTNGIPELVMIDLRTGEHVSPGRSAPMVKGIAAAWARGGRD